MSARPTRRSKVERPLDARMEYPRRNGRHAIERLTRMLRATTLARDNNAQGGRRK
jgi:hypothetical protein